MFCGGVKATVVGGGIAGLAVAAALRLEGMECAVYEQAGAIEHAGAGLALWANGMNALGLLGLRDPVVQAGSLVNELLTVDNTGKPLGRTDLGRIARAYDSECVCVARTDLKRILMKAAGVERIHTGMRCIAVNQTGASGTAIFEDGLAVESDFVVVADGIQSRLREQVHPGLRAGQAGYLAWRGLAHTPAQQLAPGAALFFVGRGCQAGVFPCGQHRSYWFATQNRQARPAENSGARKRELLTLFAGWQNTLTGAIAGTEPENILENDVLDLQTPKTWGRGRMTFAGDAIHGLTPNLGQGAALAIEDAVVLAHSLRTAERVEQGLRAYEASRIARVTPIAEASRRLGRLLQSENRLLSRFARFAVGTVIAQRRSEAMLRRLLRFPEPAD